jgi:hypothetical protein
MLRSRSVLATGVWNTIPVHSALSCCIDSVHLKEDILDKVSVRLRPALPFRDQIYTRNFS